MWHRVSKYGKSTGEVGENLAFGQQENGTDYLMSLLIDDGIADNNHRRAIFNSAYTKTGMAYCSHNSQYKNMIAIVYAEEFVPNAKAEEAIKRRSENFALVSPT